MSEISIAGLHLLLCARTLALCEAAAPAAELPPAGGPRRAVAAERVPGDDPEQGAGAAQVEESAALERQEQRPLRGHLAHHPQRQRAELARSSVQSGEFRLSGGFLRALSRGSL